MYAIRSYYELVEKCRQGNNLARKELYERYGGRLFAICLRYVNDRETAQDVLHDGFIKIYGSRITSYNVCYTKLLRS